MSYLFLDSNLALRFLLGFSLMLRLNSSQYEKIYIFL
jgi:hypothetical protein